MMNVLRRRDDLACQQVVELVNDYLEGVLSRRDRKRFERHLRACPNCTAYLEQMRVTVATVGRITPDDLSPEAREEFIGLFRAWKAEEAGGPGGGSRDASGDGSGGGAGTD
jgi:anti-sigma factor RsiW